MFNRRRGGFGESVPDNDFNGMTGYEEKTEFPMSPTAPQASAASATASVGTAAPSAVASESYGFDPVSVTGERPMVFKSKDSGIYIYEYSNRFEYFIKLEASMFRFNVVYKR